MEFKIFTEGKKWKIPSWASMLGTSILCFSSLVPTTATANSLRLYDNAKISVGEMPMNDLIAQADDGSSKQEQKKKNKQKKTHDPCYRKNSGIFLTGEFLYWKVEEDEMQYATKLNPTSIDPLGTIPISGLLEQPKFTWSPGFKVGLGYFSPHHNWDVYLDWTRLRSISTTRISTSSPYEIFMIPLSGYPSPDGPIPFGLATGASNHVRFHIDTLDLEMGRRLKVHHSLVLRPNVGVKGAWLKQNYTVNFVNAVIQHNNIGLTPQTYIFKNTYKAVGPRLGIDSEYYLFSRFGIIANIATSMMYGQFNFKRIVTNLIDPVPNPSVFGFKNTWRLRPMMEMLVGFAWDWCFSDKYILSLNAAYETQYWWKQMPFVDSTATPHQVGDLTTHGLTTGIRLDF